MGVNKGVNRKIKKWRLKKKDTKPTLSIIHANYSAWGKIRERNMFILVRWHNWMIATALSKTNTSARRCNICIWNIVADSRTIIGVSNVLFTERFAGFCIELKSDISHMSWNFYSSSAPARLWCRAKTVSVIKPLWAYEDMHYPGITAHQLNDNNNYWEWV